MTTRRHLTYYFLTTLLVFNLGCFGSDDAPNAPEIPNVDDPAVELITTEGTILAQTLVGIVPQLTDSGLWTKSIEEIYYDESCGCWIWSVYDGNENSNPFWSRQMNFMATFFNGETPQMAFEGADRVSLDLTYYYTWGDYQETTFTSKSVTFNLALGATGWGGGVLSIDGTGTGDVSGGTGNYEDKEWTGFYEEFSVGVDYTMPLAGCPTGSIDLATEEASFNMDFNGSATAMWGYSVGSNTVSSGDFPLGCGNP